jgi:hypothetical protein
MAYRELDVIEIREVLRRYCLGDGSAPSREEREAIGRRPPGRGARWRRIASTSPGGPAGVAPRLQRVAMGAGDDRLQVGP